MVLKLSSQSKDETTDIHQPSVEPSIVIDSTVIPLKLPAPEGVHGQENSGHVTSRPELLCAQIGIRSATETQERSGSICSCWVGEENGAGGVNGEAGDISTWL